MAVEIITRSAQETEALGLDAADDACLAVGIDLGGGIMAAAVYQIKAIDAAMMLGR